jgi:flagellar L-ring protein precursor FlgH
MTRYFLLAAALCGIGCPLASGQQQQNPQPADRAAPPAAAEPPQRRILDVGELMRENGGSLTRAAMSIPSSGSREHPTVINPYAVPEPEPKVLKKHDFITIIINEQSDITSDGTSDLKKSTDFDAHLDEMIKLKLKNAAIQGGAQGVTPPSVKFGGSRDTKGDAKLETKDSFTMRITAEVMDVKPNGTVAIQARKRIKHDDEEQEYVMTGFCRSADLTPDNSIVSSQINDMSIETHHKGAVRDTTKRGLVPSLLDFVNPF